MIFSSSKQHNFNRENTVKRWFNVNVFKHKQTEDNFSISNAFVCVCVSLLAVDPSQYFMLSQPKRCCWHTINSTDLESRWFKKTSYFLDLSDASSLCAFFASFSSFLASSICSFFFWICNNKQKRMWAWPLTDASKRWPHECVYSSRSALSVQRGAAFIARVSAEVERSKRPDDRSALYIVCVITSDGLVL